MCPIARKSRTISDFRVPTVEAIREERKKRPIAVMLTVYGDESHDGKMKRVYAIAGLIGTREQWDVLKAQWLEATGGMEFHSTDCEAGKGDFKDIPENERVRLHRKLAAIIANSGIKGFGYAIDIEGFRKVAPKSIPKNAPYYNCFAGVVRYLARVARPKQVEFIFHQQIEVQYNAGHIYNFLVTKKGWEKYTTHMKGIVAFAPSTEPEIQVADLVARETMKDCLYYLSDREYRNISFRSLVDSGRFYFVNYTGESFASFSALYVDPDECAIIQREYEEWRTKKRCQDNDENRIKFLFGRREKK